jgi:hypothetical protein
MGGEGERIDWFDWMIGEKGEGRVMDIFKHIKGYQNQRL